MFWCPALLFQCHTLVVVTRYVSNVHIVSLQSRADFPTLFIRAQTPQQMRSTARSHSSWRDYPELNMFVEFHPEFGKKTSQKRLFPKPGIPRNA
eukprot:6472189-Amphidinium_carterae.1